MFIDNLGMSRKLALGFGAVLLLLALVGGLSLLGITHAVEDGEVAVRSLRGKSELKSRVIDHQRWVMEIGAGLARGNVEDVAAEEDPAKCSFGSWYARDGRRLLADAASSDKDLLGKIDLEHQAIHSAWLEIKRLYADRPPGFAERAAELLADDIMSGAKRFHQILDAASEAISAKESERILTMSRDARRITAGILTASLAAILLGCFFALAVSRSVSKPLARIVEAADAIAVGDINHSLGLDGRADEIGALGRAFERMTASLRGAADAVRRMAEGDLGVEFRPRSERDEMGKALAEMAAGLGEITRELKRTVGVLAGSASQIATAATQFATAAAETATAVSQTTATVEEVKQTAQLTSRKARIVAEASRSATKVAGEGKTASDVLGQGMQGISEKMDFIAQTIVRLAEKSQDIGNIAQSVRGLADQSNILSVNASIEASKAGEGGKGFRVVAGEIRSLAEQSKESMARVRGIIDEIQKATSAAVMATEEGSKAVEAGRGHVRGAREAIVRLAVGVEESTQAATQIAASSKEELVGMDQVAQAMENIRQASAQNLESARQLEDAVSGIRDLADTLRGMLSRFRV